MKRTLSIALAVLTMGLLGSCSKINERLDNLEKEVSGIENEQIASINSQISGITSSIADLGQIRSDISSLKQSASDHSVDIFNLEEADRALKDRILNLEDYVDAVLPNYAEKEWVEATFSTLEQYEATCDTIAKIDAKLGSTSEKLSKDIKATADSLTKWVNKQFEGYYTAAQMDAKLTQMKSDIDSAKAAGGITDAKADSIATELTNAKAAVDTAKANIRAEYRAAIDTAIKASEGKLTKEITDAISEVNGKIESLTTRVGNLETSVNNLLGRVQALEGMIQSVVIVPAYSDGSVEIQNDSLYLDFIVSPSKAVANLEAGNVAVLVNKVKTKAYSGVDTIKIREGDLFEKDDTKGTVSVRVSVVGKIPVATDSTITVAVNVQNGISDFTTEFVTVTVTTKPIKTIADVLATVSGGFPEDKAGEKYPVAPSNAWTNENGSSAFIYSSALILQHDGYTYGQLTTTVTKGENCYTASISYGNLEFNMTNGILTSFTFIPDQSKPKAANYAGTYTAPTLSGVFTVSADGKKVHFSKGNLQATYNSSASTYTWGFAANQYSRIGNAAGNTTIDTQTDGAVVDLFGWVGASSTTFTSSPKIYGVSTSMTASDYGNVAVEALKADWGTAIDDKGTWRTLSKDEWKYLLTKHSKKWATVNGVNGYVIAPDGFAGTLSDTYADDAALAANNLVFLPAAGCRNGSGVGYVVEGYYWSSTAYGESEAYSVNFDNSSVNPGSYDFRNYGFSVRLVTEVK